MNWIKKLFRRWFPKISSQLETVGDPWPTEAIAERLALGLPVLSISRLQCAWCEDVMRPGSEPVSHGICPKCYVKMIQDDDG